MHETPEPLDQMLSRERKKDSERESHNWITASVSISILSLVPIFLSIPLMRPIADDYAFAANIASRGLFSGSMYWYSEQFGGVTFNFLSSLFIAPLVAWPWGVSYLPFVLSLLLIVFGGVWIVTGTLFRRLSVPVSLGTALAGVSLWVLAVGNIGPAHDVRTLFGHFNWISASYRVIAVWLFIISLLVLRHLRSRPTWVAIGIGLLLGLVVGLNLVFETLAFLFVAIVIMIGASSRRYREAYASHLPALLGFTAGLLLALPVMLLSPGALKRAETFSPGGHLSPANMAWELQSYLREIANPSMAVVFLAALCMTLLIVRSGQKMDTHQHERTTLLVYVLLALTGALVVFGSLGSQLAYSAVWHKWAALQSMFLLVVVLGVRVGVGLAPMTGLHRLKTWWIGVTFYVCLASTLIPSIALLRLESERNLVWESGRAAPLDYMSDREAPTTEQAWNTVVAERSD